MAMQMVRLSRLPLPSNKSIEYSRTPSVFNVHQIEALPMTATEVQKIIKSDPLLKKVLHYTKRGWPEQVPEALKPFSRRRAEFSIKEDCLILG